MPTRARKNQRRPPRERAQTSPRADLPRRLADELTRTARPGAAPEAQRWMVRFRTARARGESAEAHRAAVRAKQSAPRSQSVREGLGLVAYELENWHEAAQELLAYRRFSGDHRHDAVIADCYRRLGRSERALDLLEDLDPAGVTPNVWVDAQIVRARALADAGRTTIAVELLRSTHHVVKPAPEAQARLDEAIADLAGK